MATEDIKNTLLQEYYLPENAQDINSATCGAFIMFSVFALLGLILVSYLI